MAVVPVPGCATEPEPHARSRLPAFCTQFAGVLGGVTVWAEAAEARNENAIPARAARQAALIERMMSSVMRTGRARQGSGNAVRYAEGIIRRVT